jgi:AhpD family alkylhydroperoxidase
VTGITNAMNVVADAFEDGPFPGVVPDLVRDDVERTFADIRTFYAIDDVPATFRMIAHDARYLSDFWDAVRHAFTDQQLTRRLKEALAFAVSVTSRSRFGSAFHLRQMRRFGVTDRGVMEVLGVTQLFSSYTKIADTLQLEPDMGDLAPVDLSPAPGATAVRQA